MVTHGILLSSVGPLSERFLRTGQGRPGLINGRKARATVAKARRCLPFMFSPSLDEGRPGLLSAHWSRVLLTPGGAREWASHPWPRQALRGWSRPPGSSRQSGDSRRGVVRDEGEGSIEIIRAVRPGPFSPRRQGRLQPIDAGRPRAGSRRLAPRRRGTRGTRPTPTAPSVSRGARTGRTEPVFGDNVGERVQRQAKCQGEDFTAEME